MSTPHLLVKQSTLSTNSSDRVRRISYIYRERFGGLRHIRRFCFRVHMLNCFSFDFFLLLILTRQKMQHYRSLLTSHLPVLSLRESTVIRLLSFQGWCRLEVPLQKGCGQFMNRQEVAESDGWGGRCK